MIIKQHFYWSKQWYTKISISIYGKKRTDIIDLSYNIEECLAVNDYFTDWLEFEIINFLRRLLLHINKSRRKYLYEADDNQTFDSIQYKILLLVYKAFTNGSPTYLADMMTSCNPVRSTRSLHKVNLLVVPHQKSNKYSEKAFAVVGPRLWNELLTDELRSCNSVDTFKKKLKTMLFKKTLLTFYYVLLYVLLIFRDYVEICNSSVDGFTQHVSYFCCTIDWYLCFRYWCLSQIYYYYYYSSFVLILETDDPLP